MSRFRFIVAEKAHYPVARLCRVLQVSRSGFYAWLGRQPSPRVRADVALTVQIQTIHRESRGTYGAPRVHAELADAHGIHCGRKRVARLMRAAGLTGGCRRRTVPTTQRDEGTEVADDLVKRAFTASAPDRLWVADITSLTSWEGFLYLAVVLVGFSRRVVGWAMADNRRAELVVEALQMAIWRRRPNLGLVHHSDRGGQYVSLIFGQTARAAGIDLSNGRQRLRARQRRLRGVLRVAQEGAHPPWFMGHPRA